MTSPSPRGALGAGGVFWSFAPWIIFEVVAGPSTWKFAAFAALIASVVLNLPDLRQGSVKVLNAAALAFFAVVSVLALALSHHDLVWLETYAQVISNAVVAVVALGSLAFVPFTEQYARESTPREIWGTPGFTHVNRVLTLMWGLVFAVTAVLGLVAIHDTVDSDWLNWVIPIALLVLAVKFTNWYPQHVRSQSMAARARVVHH
ncbi:hypothetical protein [Streptomyces sp. ICBB 8177]|uniref:hypothetical protein n=1 Tax=Streptomyces sp. ICBB 8177 TaxID=563922 RepID=UPI000D685198|nr:hypothetical protein [Streptomyces sp. ICBB 8177]PWI44209.1 hypothetical protein CK485_19585 [Streptomyces sp. ICBB 8177]